MFPEKSHGKYPTVNRPNMKPTMVPEIAAERLLNLLYFLQMNQSGAAKNPANKNVKMPPMNKENMLNNMNADKV